MATLHLFIMCHADKTEQDKLAKNWITFKIWISGSTSNPQYNFGYWRHFQIQLTKKEHNLEIKVL